jgi:hypothetical protein
MSSKPTKENTEDQQNWAEVSEGEEEDLHKKAENNEHSDKKESSNPVAERPAEPKKTYLKTKTGDIVIDKLEKYVEPVKQVREARGDVSKFFHNYRTSK